MNRNSFSLSAIALLAMSAPAFSQAFIPGDLVISTVSETAGVIATGSNNGLDTAAPIVLDQFQLGSGGATATSVSTLSLPQTSSGANSAISGEYGSASEGILQDSVNGQYLTIMGYGVNANAFNTAPLSTYGTAALGQTTSLASTTGSTAVPRVVALIGADGSVNTSTALYNVFNTNNPRSVATVDGSSFYVSGQGASEGDSTEGVAYAMLGATTATVIDNTTDTRVVSIINNGSGNTLFVSRDVNPSGSGHQNFSNVSTLTGPTGGLPTSSVGLVTTHVTPPATPNSSGGNNGSINLTSTAFGNGINDVAGLQTRNGVTIAGSNATSRVGTFVYVSPEQYFFASPTVMYVTDSGQPKNGNADKAAEGAGGLQKWVLTDGTWTFAYDLAAGLNLVNNDQANASTNTAAGVTGLFGLTGELVNGGSNVELFATSYGLNELSPSYLFEITDDLSATSGTDASVESESFNTLYSAPAGTSIRGVAFAPQAVPEPGTWGLATAGLGLLLTFQRARRRS
jgi:hypothetical protein